MNYVYIRHNAVPIPLLLLFNELVTKSTRYVPLVEQDLPTLPEHLSSPPVLSMVLVAQSLFFLCSTLQFIVCPFSFWSLFCSSFFDLRLLITSFGIFKLLVIVLSVLPFTASDYLPLVSSNFWSLYCLSFDLRLLITSLGIFKLLFIVLSVLLLFTTSDSSIDILAVYREQWTVNVLQHTTQSDNIQSNLPKRSSLLSSHLY